MICESVIANRIGHLVRISRIDSVNLGSLEQGVATHLDRPQGGGCIGCEIGVTRPGREYDNTAFFHVANSPPADIGFANRRHGNCRLNTGVDAMPFQQSLDSKGIDDCCQHAHVISGSAFNTLARRFDASKKVSAADDKAKLDTEGQDTFYLVGNTVDGGRVEPKLPIAHKRFTGKLQEYSAMSHFFQPKIH